MDPHSTSVTRVVEDGVYIRRGFMQLVYSFETGAPALRSVLILSSLSSSETKIMYMSDRETIRASGQALYEYPTANSIDELSPGRADSTPRSRCNLKQDIYITLRGVFTSLKYSKPDASVCAKFG